MFTSSLPPRTAVFPRILCTLSFTLIPAPSALAYFDPASGSLALQMILGGIAGVAVVIKLYWHKFLGLFGIATSRDSGDKEAEAISTDDG